MEDKKNKSKNKIVSIVVLAVVILVAVVICIVFLNKDNKGGNNDTNTIGTTNEVNQTGQNNTPDTFVIGNETITGPVDAPNNDVPLDPTSTPTDGNQDQVPGSVSTD